MSAHERLRRCAATVVCAAAALLGFGAPPARGDGKPVGDGGQVARPDLVFRVDAARRIRAVEPLNGVNAGPGHVKPGAGQPLTDAKAAYGEMGVRRVRFHDIYGASGHYGPCDLTHIFGSDWSKDPENDANYNWAETDEVVAAAGAIHAQALFRFGESWHNANARPSQPPLVFIAPRHHETVARVCCRIAARYGGARSRVVRLWEIWNEPNLRKFWDEPFPQETYFNLYATVAKRLKAAFPGIVVGGPGAAGGTDAEVLAFARAFVQACRAKEAPLDFYSWHSYNRRTEGPACYARQARLLRPVLDKNGYDGAALVLGEWNATKALLAETGQAPPLDDIHAAAFDGAALVYLHRYSDVRYAYLYRGDVHGGDHGYGLLRPDLSIKKPGYAFKAYARLFAAGAPVQLLQTTGDNQKNIAAMATIAEDESALAVLVCFWHSVAPATVMIRNLPKALAMPAISCFRVSAAEDGFEYPVAIAAKGPGWIAVSLRQPRRGDSAVHLIELRPGASRPAERERDDRVHPIRRPPVLRPRPPRPAPPRLPRPPVRDPAPTARPDR